MTPRKTWAVWWDRVVALGGHRSGRTLGVAWTVYAFGTAMHGAVNVDTAWGVLCVAWPSIGLRATSWPPYLYLSPNSTPWAATLLIGGEFSRDERRMARARRALWGHGYDPEVLDPQVLGRAIEAAEFLDDCTTRPLIDLIRERRGWGHGRAAREWGDAP